MFSVFSSLAQAAEELQTIDVVVKQFEINNSLNIRTVSGVQHSGTQMLLGSAKVAKLTGKMVLIPPGKFSMGANTKYKDESPVHVVSIVGFKMGETEVTFAQWDACVAGGGCKHKPDERWGRGDMPVTNVSHNDIINDYIPWLNKRTGLTFRLPTEAEWEYAARAYGGDSTQLKNTKFNWGDSIDCAQARYGNHSGHSDDCGDERDPVPVKSYKANAFGLYDMHGNVWEWTQDCWNDNYDGAPNDGSAWTVGDCMNPVLRGGSWSDELDDLRSANRIRGLVSERYSDFGFRLVVSH